MVAVFPGAKSLLPAFTLYHEELELEEIDGVLGRDKRSEEENNTSSLEG